MLCAQPRAPAPQSNVTFVDRAQAALNAAGAVEKAGAALSAAQVGAASGNTNLVGGISNAIQAAQARPSATIHTFCFLVTSGNVNLPGDVSSAMQAAHARSRALFTWPCFLAMRQLLHGALHSCSGLRRDLCYVTAALPLLVPACCCLPGCHRAVTQLLMNFPLLPKVEEAGHCSGMSASKRVKCATPDA